MGERSIEPQGEGRRAKTTGRGVGTPVGEVLEHPWEVLEHPWEVLERLREVLEHMVF